MKGLQDYKVVLAFLLCAFSLLVSCKDDVSKSPSKASSEKNWKFIFKERKQYFMHMEKCDTLRTSFQYMNSTDSVQYIDTVKTSCGCTAVNYLHKPIKPGESGVLQVAIAMYGTEGFFSKSIGVYFHGQKPVVLKVMGKIGD